LVTGNIPGLERLIEALRRHLAVPADFRGLLLRVVTAEGTHTGFRLLPPPFTTLTGGGLFRLVPLMADGRTGLLGARRITRAGAEAFLREALCGAVRGTVLSATRTIGLAADFDSRGVRMSFPPTDEVSRTMRKPGAPGAPGFE